MTGTCLEAVLDDSVLCDTPLVEVTVAKITDNSQISRLVLELNNKLPIPTLVHMKRVHRGEIILYFSEKESKINEVNLNSTGLDMGNLRQVKVASVLPKTKKQHLKACQTWHCNFHENIYLEKLLSNTLFTRKELEEHCDWMREAIKAAKRSKIQVGAVVVDPVTKTVLAIASDNRTAHPMKHAVMVAVDLVARGQGGGLWPVRDGDFVVEKNKKADVTHSKRDYSDVPKPSGPYLCTGYDVYITREPCTMCAMALVHSRARRVFYGDTYRSGALGTLVKLHILKGLNHRYEVFKNLLVEECASLCS